jgi:VanZ family protein
MQSAPDLRHANKAPRGFQLAWILALAYLLIIVYASLQPFRSWRFPPEEILRFLFAPWPRYITIDDILINLAAYVPLGFLFALSLRSRMSAGAAVALATLLSLSTSLAMESAQMFLPSRIASNVDLLTNGTGALFGALTAPLLSTHGFPGSRLAALRHRLFVPGTLADGGLVIVFLWLFTHLHPTVQLFGTGSLRNTLELPAYFIHTPQLLLLAESAVVFFNLLGLGLLISALLRLASKPRLPVAAVICSGLLIKFISVLALAHLPGLLAWLTPGVSLGLAAGALLFHLLAGLSRPARIATAMVCFCAAIVAINLAPDNPYQTVPPQLLAGKPSHYLSFSAIIRALSELWPFLTVAYLLATAGAGAVRKPS